MISSTFFSFSIRRALSGTPASVMMALIRSNPQRMSPVLRPNLLLSGEYEKLRTALDHLLIETDEHEVGIADPPSRRSPSPP